MNQWLFRAILDFNQVALVTRCAVSRTARLPFRAEKGGKFLAVNAGRDESNYQVSGLAAAVARHVPGTKVSINTNAPPDKRSYKVDFSLFKSLAPDASRTTAP